MKIFNKNSIRQRINIFLLLALYMGLCFEAAALDVMELGESHELDKGYSIKVDNVEGDKALFVLYKEERWVDEANVISGDRFSLDDGKNFYFEATLDSIFRREDMNMVELTDYHWEWKLMMELGESHKLDEGYSIKVDNVEGDKALFVLYKEEKWVDEAHVISGDRFSLDDGKIFHFEATFDWILYREDTNMVELTDYYWELRPDPSVTISHIILILSSVTIVLISTIFIRNRLKNRRDLQKTEGYKEKMHEWEKEGYDISELKEVLGDEKRF
ncbi:MAG: hypothetical protein U9Q68_09505 [Euryarchaeota archaeon]|nr:hypothetical protein [Euryarchaeota archaeon]